LHACQSETSSPEEIAKKYLKSNTLRTRKNPHVCSPFDCFYGMHTYAVMSTVVWSEPKLAWAEQESIIHTLSIFNVAQKVIDTFLCYFGVVLSYRLRSSQGLLSAITCGFLRATWTKTCKFLLALFIEQLRTWFNNFYEYMIFL
jgi:hypothetical protein